MIHSLNFKLQSDETMIEAVDKEKLRKVGQRNSTKVSASYQMLDGEILQSHFEI